MILLLSPAKSINETPEDVHLTSKDLLFHAETATLLQILQSYSKTVLQQVLGVNPALAR